MLPISSRAIVTSRRIGGAAGPSAITPDYELSGRVQELDERETGGCTAHLRLRPARTPRRQRPRRCSSNIFASDQPCTPGDAASFAEAMSKAAQDVSTGRRAGGGGRSEVSGKDKRRKGKNDEQIPTT
jgi:hypothetical protein